MDTEILNAVNIARHNAGHLVITKQIYLAEDTYRNIIDTVQRHEGQEAAYLDRYNLSNVLVLQHKYQEAEPMLRNILKYLTKRPVDDNTGHFLEQEDGAIRLLVQSIEGQDRNEEAEKLIAGASYVSREGQLQVRQQGYGLHL